MLRKQFQVAKQDVLKIMTRSFLCWRRRSSGRSYSSGYKKDEITNIDAIKFITDIFENMKTPNTFASHCAKR
jgi:hypothetical protein